MTPSIATTSSMRLRRTAADISARCRMSDAARALAASQLSARRFFDRLLESGLHSDAVQVFPHLLPKRVAVWWGCLCSWQARRPDLRAEEENALGAALRWVFDSSEENRRAAQVVAKVAGMTTSAGCLALAAFYSDGSLSRPDLPPVPPAPHLTAAVVGGAVLLAAVEREPMEYAAHYRQFLALGLDVAQRRILWTEDAGDRLGTMPAVPAWLQTIPEMVDIAKRRPAAVEAWEVLQLAVADVPSEGRP